MPSEYPVIKIIIAGAKCGHPRDGLRAVGALQDARRPLARRADPGTDARPAATRALSWARCAGRGGAIPAYRAPSRRAHGRAIPPWLPPPSWAHEHVEASEHRRRLGHMSTGAVLQADRPMFRRVRPGRSAEMSAHVSPDGHGQGAHVLCVADGQAWPRPWCIWGPDARDRMHRSEKG